MDGEDDAWFDRELAGCSFVDERLNKRLRKLVAQIGSAMGQSIPLVCQDWANTKAAYRFFSNDRVGENVRLADPVVGEKTICGLGISPVLAHQRDALAHGAPDLRHQFAEPLIQALVDKTAASKLAIKPCVVFPVHRHRSSRESVPDKESRSIPVTQHICAPQTI